jgi:hypothetical protein
VVSGWLMDVAQRFWNDPATMAGRGPNDNPVAVRAWWLAGAVRTNYPWAWEQYWKEVAR